VKSSIAESYAKFDMAAWLEEIARCPHTFRSGEGAMLAIDRADILADRYVSARKRHFSIIWRQTLFALMLEAVGSTVLLGLGGWLVINRQLTLGQLVASELIVTLVLASLSKIGKYVEIFYDLQATLDKLGILDKLPPEPISGERLDEGGPLGVLEYDHIDAQSLDLAVTRQQVAYVGRAEVFAGTIEENFRLGRTWLSASQIRRALDLVGLSNRVARLPDGMQTLLNPDGQPFSNNEIARLAVARAIAGQPRLLLIVGMLDALAVEACPNLLDAIFDPEAGWTLVVVTARSDIRQRCDRVVEWT
jgi:putative ABC transport system ATP-binding protein